MFSLKNNLDDYIIDYDYINNVQDIKLLLKALDITFRIPTDIDKIDDRFKPAIEKGLIIKK